MHDVHVILNLKHLLFSILPEKLMPKGIQDSRAK